MKLRAGFTLTELLVSLGIVAALAALLVPVFARSRSAAERAKCQIHFRQAAGALFLYQGDYDDRYVVPKYSGRIASMPTSDRTWVQLTLPYLRQIDTYLCPTDRASRDFRQAVFDPDLRVGDTWQRYYAASMRVNTGYNFVYLAPLVRTDGGDWAAFPRSGSEPTDPASTLMMGDSVWSVTNDGLPEGGGSYLILPPCRYAEPGRLDTFNLPAFPNSRFFTSNLDWESPQTAKPRTGGLWPWHEQRLTTVYADGHTRTITLKRVAEGCRVAPEWDGIVDDLSRYLWDLN